MSQCFHASFSYGHLSNLLANATCTSQLLLMELGYTSSADSTTAEATGIAVYRHPLTWIRVVCILMCLILFCLHVYVH